jgi:acetyl-CoA acetyltransferase
VTEQDILDLEREAFLKLLGNEKTQERIAYTLKTASRCGTDRCRRSDRFGRPHRGGQGQERRRARARGVTPIDISALVMREAAMRGGLDPRHIDDVMWGCAMPEASQGLNVARNAALKANFPVDASAATINRFCSVGAAERGERRAGGDERMQDVVVAGGVEMMSQVPMSGYHTRLHPELTESYIGMGFTASAWPSATR